MGQRVVRVNELVKREISEVLHTRYKTDSIHITITEVDVSPNLRSARVYYSVIGDAENQKAAAAFFRKEGEDIRRRIGRKIVLKYLPHLEFILDDSMERGARLNRMLDELGLEGE